MADDYSYEFRGFDTLAKTLAALGSELTDDTSNKMVKAGGRVVKEAIIERAPILTEKNQGSNSLEPGALKGDVHVYLLRNQLIPTVAVGFGKTTSKIAPLIEYGHRLLHGTDAIGEVPAHPFVRVSYEESIGRAEASMVAVLERTMKDKS